MDIIKRILGQHKMDEDELSPEGTVIHGKILSLNEKGYGFISSKDLKFTKIYFHWSALEQDTLNFLALKRGMQLEFRLIYTVQGPRAIKIRVMNPEEKKDE